MPVLGTDASLASMTIIAFAGPSLPPVDRSRFAGIEWRPPAEAGDLMRLSGGPSLTVCLIDGYFDHRPSVRHKEILLLLSMGARIFGASSIGALRAAEMAPFGMIGTGAIFRAFASGRLSGDDEVAIVHASEELDWKPLSVPLVDIRATLCRALRERILAPAVGRELLNAAQAIHYIDRSWTALFSVAPLTTAELEGFRAWLKLREVPLKRLDARACVSAALAAGEAGRARPEFVPTAFVQALARELGIDLRSERLPERPSEARSAILDTLDPEMGEGTQSKR